jgi:hypothetical protein
MPIQKWRANQFLKVVQYSSMQMQSYMVLNQNLKQCLKQESQVVQTI